MDIIQQAALNFEKLSNTQYELTLSGEGNEKVILSVKPFDFLHTVGLSHLKDIPAFTAEKYDDRRMLLRELKRGTYTLNYLQNNSIYFAQGVQDTYNSATGQRCTIEERVTKMANIAALIESAKNASFYNWDLSKSRIGLPVQAPDYAPNRKKYNQIQADCLIVIQSPYNQDEKLYLFAYQSNSKKGANEPAQYKIHSAFADCVDLTQGQDSPRKIVMEEKYNIDRRGNPIGEKERIFITDSYKQKLEKQEKKKNDKAKLKDLLSDLKISRDSFCDGQSSEEVYREKLENLKNFLKEEEHSAKMCEKVLKGLNKQNSEYDPQAIQRICIEDEKQDIQIILNQKSGKNGKNQGGNLQGNTMGNSNNSANTAGTGIHAFWKKIQDGLKNSFEHILQPLLKTRDFFISSITNINAHILKTSMQTDTPEFQKNSTFIMNMVQPVFQQNGIVYPASAILHGIETKYMPSGNKENDNSGKTNDSPKQVLKVAESSEHSLTESTQKEPGYDITDSLS